MQSGEKAMRRRADEATRPVPRVEVASTATAELVARLKVPMELIASAALDHAAKVRDSQMARVLEELTKLRATMDRAIERRELEDLLMVDAEGLARMLSLPSSRPSTVDDWIKAGKCPPPDLTNPKRWAVARVRDWVLERFGYDRQGEEAAA